MSVKTRRVFYIPGYDPLPPRRYRELYRTEGAAQAAISGYDLSLSPRKGERFGWIAESGETRAEIEVLVWSDIVRDSMETGIIGTYRQMVATAWRYIGSGALRRLMWLRKGPVIAALYPIFALIVQALLALTAYALGAGLLTWLIHPLAAIAALPLIPLVLIWFKKNDGKFFAYYLMHDYAYSAQHDGANPPELEARMAEFTDIIEAAMRSDVDEVLLVGHSSGAHLGVSVLADLIRQRQLPPGAPALGFLSLGQVVPMVSFLPGAWRLRRDLRYLSEREELAWVDVTAPGDGCSFALCDPVAVSGVAPEGQRWPLIFSAAFTQSLSVERWRELKRRYFRLHFQYLCAFDRPKDYDYFQITAGPLTLRDRYAGRTHSRSRITRAASPYTSTAP
ncbi:MAG: hypothetical protein ACU0CI_09705 [Shimia sp.]